MKFLILFAVVLGVAGVHLQSQVATPQPTVASPERASDKAKDPYPLPGSDVYRVGGSVKPPIVVKQVQAKYSTEARKKKISSDVVIRMIVDENGLPQEVSVVRPAGHGLDEEAIKAARQYRFRPATRDGQPVKVVINLNVTFQIY